MRKCLSSYQVKNCKDKEWLAYELGMPLDEIEATIDDIEYVDKHGLNKKIFGL